MAVACAAVLAAIGGRPVLALVGAAALGGITATTLVLMLARERESKALAELSREARTDPLTGLANRRELEERFEYELSRSEREGRPLGVVAVDLDRFKQVNDELGHDAGDRALCEVANVLRQSVRGFDTVARVGGDEFTILLPGTPPSAALETAERLRGAVNAVLAAYPGPLSASSGVAVFPEHGAGARSLLRAADEALYAAKNMGRDRTEIQPMHGTTEPVAEAGGREASRVEVLLALAAEVDRRKGGSGATWRSGLYAEALARALSLPAGTVRQVRLAAMLQDVGEVGVPEAILSSPRPLRDEEWGELRRHPETSARMVREAGLPEPAGWIYAHHERPDASGYPRALGGERIPVEARILAVAGAYSAMQSRRSYRPPLPAEQAMEQLLQGAGTRFDLRVVEAFASLRDNGA